MEGKLALLLLLYSPLPYSTDEKIKAQKGYAIAWRQIFHGGTEILSFQNGIGKWQRENQN